MLSHLAVMEMKDLSLMGEGLRGCSLHSLFCCLLAASHHAARSWPAGKHSRSCQIPWLLKANIRPMGFDFVEEACSLVFINNMLFKVTGC